MIEGTHGVERMGGRFRPGAYAGPGLLTRSVAVAQADAHSQAGRVRNGLFRAGQFGRDGHQADPALGRLPEAVEQFHGGCQQLVLSVGSTLVRREKWTFEVNAKGTRTVYRAVQELCQTSQGSQ